MTKPKKRTKRKKKTELTIRGNKDEFKAKRFSSSSFYLDVYLDFDGKCEDEIDENHFKCIVVTALRKMFGSVGAAIPVSILKYRNEDKRAFIRCPAKDVEKVRIALTVFSKYNDFNCAFRINKVRPDDEMIKS